MAVPPTKRFREGSTDSCSSDSIGPDGIFPSDDEEEHCFFPSEDSNQTLIALETSTFNEPLSDSALSDLEVTQTEESGRRIGENRKYTGISVL